jgi:hypothetical protein
MYRLPGKVRAIQLTETSTRGRCLRMGAWMGIAQITALLLGAVSAGCERKGQHDFEVIAPAFETSRVRLTQHDFLPVGAFREQRAELIPFMDANGDGRFDSQTEASGRCDPRSHQCFIDHSRLRVIMTVTDCPATTGTWLVGNMYDRDGRRLDATLCDSQGVCSEEHQNAFQNGGTVDAIWIPGIPDTSSTRALGLRASHEEIRYENVALPLPIRLVDIRVERVGGLRVSVRADYSIDMASLWLMHGGTMRWSSTGQPGVFRATGAALEAAVPQSVLDSCGSGCEAYLQFAHVWRDDNVFSVSDVLQKVL